MRHLVEALGVGRRLLERPELQRERAHRGLEQVRQIEMIGAETHAVFAQRRARVLVEPLHLLGDAVALQDAKRLGQLERDAARDAGDVLGRGQCEQRPKQLFQMRLEPEIEPRLHGIARGAGQMLVGQNAHARPHHLVAGREPRHRLALPAHHAVRGEHELLVGRMAELGGARLDLAGERLLRGSAQRFRFRSSGGRIGGELKTKELPDRVPLDNDFASFRDFGFEHCVLAQPPHQHTGPAIDEALGQTFVQRVGQPILHAARDALPVLGIGEPVRTVCRKSPGPDVGDTVR